MNISEATISKEFVKSLLKLKILNNSKLLDVSASNKGSVSTTITPICKTTFDHSNPTENNSSPVSKDFNKDSILCKVGPRMKSKENSETLKSRLDQSYKSLSVETNNKVNKWKNECNDDELRMKEKEKFETFLKKINGDRKKSNINITSFDSLNKPPQIKSEKFFNSFKGIERNPRYAKSDNMKLGVNAMNKNLKRIDSKEFADKIIVNLHNRMDSFTKTYDNISQKLNKMIVQVKETDDEQELTIESKKKPCKINLRYENDKDENE